MVVHTINTTIVKISKNPRYSPKNRANNSLTFPKISKTPHCPEYATYHNYVISHIPKRVGSFPHTLPNTSKLRFNWYFSRKWG